MCYLSLSRSHSRAGRFQLLQCTDSVVCRFSCSVAWQIFSFPIRYGTCVPCISRRILTHREVPQILLTLKGSWGPSGVWGSSLENHCFPSVVLNEAEEGDLSSFQGLWATSGDIFGCHHWWGGSVQFSSVQSLSRVRLSATPWIAHARPPCPSPTPGVHSNSRPSLTRWTWVWVNSGSSLKLTSIESVMPSSHLIFCCPLLLLPPIPPSISLFQWLSSSHEVAKVLEFQL